MNHGGHSIDTWRGERDSHIPDMHAALARVKAHEATVDAMAANDWRRTVALQARADARIDLMVATRRFLEADAVVREMEGGDAEHQSA